MARPVSQVHSDITLTVGEPTEYRPEPDTPLRILLLGDFRGRGGRAGETALADRRAVPVDRDNFDEVLGWHGVTLELPLGGQETSLTIPLRELDDFHPDRLYRSLEVFRAMRELRAELGDPETFERAAARLGVGAARDPAPPRERPPAPAPSAGLLDEILGDGASTPAPPAAPGGEVESFIRDIVAPYLTPGIDRARQAELLATVDEAVSARMRAILHHPRFQAVEAAWRAAFFLVRRLETGADLQLYLADVTKEELAADLAASDDLRDTGLWRLLFERGGAKSGQPWGLLVGLYAFGPGPRDVGLLARLAELARRANAPWLAEASPALLGSPSLAEAPAPRDWKPLEAADEENWRDLRRLPEAAYLGLALPRMLLRLPYGKEASSVEEFGFEELPPGSPHESYLWGNPAVACAYLLAEAFGRQGWGLRPGEVREITGLPLHVYREDGEGQVKPCSEVVLSDRAVEAILERGLMPLLSQPGRDAVRLARFQSLSATSPALAGGWSG